MGGRSGVSIECKLDPIIHGSNVRKIYNKMWQDAFYVFVVAAVDAGWLIHEVPAIHIVTFQCDSFSFSHSRSTKSKLLDGQFNEFSMDRDAGECVRDKN